MSLCDFNAPSTNRYRNFFRIIRSYFWQGARTLTAFGVGFCLVSANSNAQMPPQADSTQSSSITSDSSAQLNLPLSLASTYQNHPRLKAERAKLRALNETFVQADTQTGLNAQILSSAGYTVAQLPANSFGNLQATGTLNFDSTPHDVQLQLIKPLYLGGRVKAQKSQSYLAILAAREALRGVEHDLFLRTASAYSQVMRDEEAARVARNSVRVLTRQLTAAQARYEVGEGTRTDIAQANTRLAAANIGLAQAEAQLQSTRATFVSLVGFEPVQLARMPEFVMPKTLEEAIRLARENNPQILAAELQERAAIAGIEVAKSAYRPMLSINGGVQAARQQLSNIQTVDGASITAQLTIPIWTGGLNASRVRASEAERSQSRYATLDLMRNLDAQVKQIWAQREAAMQIFLASAVQVSAAELAFEGVKLELDVGTRSTLDVLDAEQELQDARLAQLNAKSALEVANFQLLTIMGAFDARALSLPVDLYNAQSQFEDVAGYYDPNNTDNDPIAQAWDELLARVNVKGE